MTGGKILGGISIGESSEVSSSPQGERDSGVGLFEVAPFPILEAQIVNTLFPFEFRMYKNNYNSN